MPDWIDEAADELRDLIGTIDENNLIASTIRSHFLKAARCPTCEATGYYRDIGNDKRICHGCGGRCYVVPPTQGIR